MADENDLPPEGEENTALAPETEGDSGTQVIETDGSDASEEVSPESLASELGWCPKDDWRGNPDEWKPAPEFLKSTVDINKSLRKELRATREASERAARAAASITERAIEQERIRLMQARHEAIEMADPETAYRAEQQLMQLPPPVQAPPPQETQEFAQRHKSWLGIDPVATQMAWSLCEANKMKPAAEQFQIVEREIRKRFPEYFENKSGKAPPATETTGSRAAGHARRGPKGFNDLPANAKAAALDFEKRGRATREEYARLYWQENA